MPATTIGSGQVGLEVDEDGAGDVSVAVFDATRIGVCEIPADVEDTEVAVAESVGELVNRDQREHRRNATPRRTVRRD